MAKLFNVRLADGSHDSWMFECPGCECGHDMPDVFNPNVPKRFVWAFNGNIEKPTFSPSVHYPPTVRADGSVARDRCHFFIVDGRIQFLGDCEHALAGQTVDLPDVE